MSRASRSFHVLHGDALAVRDALRDMVSLPGPAHVTWPRDEWTTVVLGADLNEALDVAANLSRALSCSCVTLQESPDGSVLHCVRADASPMSIPVEDETAARLLDDVLQRSERQSGDDSQVACHPRSSAASRERALSFVERMQHQMRVEVAANVTWLRRHADLLSITEDLPDDPGRETEGALMSRALARLRELEAGQDSAAAADARAELRRLQADQRRAFHSLVSQNAALLDVEAPPSPGEAPEAYFAAVADRFAGRGRPEAPSPETPADSPLTRLAACLGMPSNRLRGEDSTSLVATIEPSERPVVSGEET